MARKEILSFIDDLDGAELDVEDTRTIDWSWLGVDYRLDVSSENLDNIENGKVALATLLAASRRIGGRRRSSAPKTAPDGLRTQPAIYSADPATVRQWAARNGYDVAPHGRIAGAILKAYHAAD